MAAVALSRLLPTVHPLPPRLLETADSLLALSRQRASNLKGDEEIARAHACAEIACSRLREKLRLPPIKAGTAPANAKVYRKLYGFLDRALAKDVERLTTGATPGKGTPGKRKRNDAGVGLEPDETPTKQKQRTTASTARASTATRTPSTSTFAGKIKSLASAKLVSDDEAEAPSFAMPAVRTLCRAFNTPGTTPHVYTGTCVVLKRSNFWPRPSLEEATEADLEFTDEMFKADVMALIVGLYLMVLTKMMQGKMTNRMFKGVSAKAVEMLEGLEDGEGVEGWVKRINKEGYAKGQEWWRSVPEGVFGFGMEQVENAIVGGQGGEVYGEVCGDVEEVEEVEAAGRVRKEELNLEPDPEGILLPGLGTMMQDAVDWTSEDRKHEFNEWKQEIMGRLDSLPTVTGAVEVH